MQKPYFSIVVVSLNPGKGLEKTLKSIVKQTFSSYEVILKDGESTDKSLEKLQKDGFFETYPQIRLIRKKDKGIYDGMNQAVEYVQGKYVQFLNCGDFFFEETVLEKTADFITKETNKILKKQKSDEELPIIFYGNQYNQLQKTVVDSAPEINDFTCYRNVPCHQVCFYDAVLFQKRAYSLKYKVRADYEHFLYSIYEEQALGIFMPVVVASYEGGGFSETKENRKISAKEHLEITKRYLGTAKVFRYRMVMWLTLAPLRTMMAENPAMSGVYNRIKTVIYKIIKRKL